METIMTISVDPIIVIENIFLLIIYSQNMLILWFNRWLIVEVCIFFSCQSIFPNSISIGYKWSSWLFQALTLAQSTVNEYQIWKHVISIVPCVHRFFLCLLWLGGSINRSLLNKAKFKLLIKDICIEETSIYGLPFTSLTTLCDNQMERDMCIRTH